MTRPDGTPRPLQLRVRIRAAEQKAFEGAAALDGLSLSSWVRLVLRREAAQRLRDEGRKVGRGW